MKLKSLLAAVVLAAISHTSEAASITASNLSDDFTKAVPIVTSTGTLVASNTGIVQVGTFGTLTDAQLNIGNLPALIADFQSFGSSTKFGAGFDIAGLYSLAPSAGILAGDTKIGKSIYVFIGNGDTFATSTEFAIYKDDNAFAADAPLFNAKAYPTDLPDNAAIDAAFVLGGLGAVQVAIPGLQGNFTSIQLVAVPEPSIALLGLMGLGLVRRRRA